MHLHPEVWEIGRRLGIIQCLRQAAGESDTLKAMTTDLLDHLAECDIESDQTELNALLKEFGFKKKSIRLGEEKQPRRAWHLPVDKLANIQEELEQHLPCAPPNGDYSDYKLKMSGGDSESGQDGPWWLPPDTSDEEG